MSGKNGAHTHRTSDSGVCVCVVCLELIHGVLLPAIDVPVMHSHTCPVPVTDLGVCVEHIYNNIFSYIQYIFSFFVQHGKWNQTKLLWQLSTHNYIMGHNNKRAHIGFLSHKKKNQGSPHFVWTDDLSDVVSFHQMMAIFIPTFDMAIEQFTRKAIHLILSEMEQPWK